MKKHWFSIVNVVLIVGVVLFVYFQSNGGKKIVYINTPQLINSYNGMKAARVEYQNKQKAMQANVDTLMGEMQQAIKKFEADRPGLTEKELRLSQELLETKRQQLMQYQQATGSKLKEEEQRMNNEVMGRINSFLKKYGEEHNYDLILGATTVGNVIYAKEYMDITEEVIKELNAN